MYITCKKSRTCKMKLLGTKHDKNYLNTSCRSNLHLNYCTLNVFHASILMKILQHQMLQSELISSWVQRLFSVSVLPLAKVQGQEWPVFWQLLPFSLSFSSLLSPFWEWCFYTSHRWESVEEQINTCSWCCWLCSVRNLMIYLVPFSATQGQCWCKSRIWKVQSDHCQ